MKQTLTQLITAGLLALAPSASAQLIAYDGIDYPDDASVGGQGSAGADWAGPWSASEAINPVSPGLTYSDLNTVGNKLTSNFSTPYDRSLNVAADSNAAAHGLIDANGLIGATGKTVWFSFLAKDGVNGKPFRPFSLTDSATASILKLKLSFFGQNATGSANGDGWAVGSNVMRSDFAFNLGSTRDGTDLWVGKITFGSGAAGNGDTASLWLNPTLTAGEAGLGSATVSIVASQNVDLAFDGIRSDPGAGTGLSFSDEFRIGLKAEDVGIVRIPEPATTGLIVGGLGFLALRHHRRASPAGQVSA